MSANTLRWVLTAVHLDPVLEDTAHTANTCTGTKRGARNWTKWFGRSWAEGHGEPSRPTAFNSFPLVTCAVVNTSVNVSCAIWCYTDLGLVHILSDRRYDPYWSSQTQQLLTYAYANNAVT